MHRFFISPQAINGTEAIISGPDADQIYRVLRLGVGDQVAVLDGSGRQLIGEITAQSKGEALLKILHEETPNTEASIQLVLAQALLKGEKMDLVIQKCTEIGVSSIALLNTERTIIDIPHKKLPDRLTRWQRIAKEASEQSGRTRIPSIQGPFSLSQLIEQQSKLGPVLIPWERESLPLAIATEPLKHQSPEIITLIVGPEGGFSEKEVTNAQKLGATSVSLGPRILRAETAALIASALVLHLLGE